MKYFLQSVSGSLNIPLNSKWTVDGDTVAGSAAGTSGADASSLHSNQGMQIVDNNTLYIADTGNHRVVVIQPGSTSATVIYGSGPGSADNELDSPTDVFVTSAFVYILDTNNNRVQRWSRDGSNVTTVAGINGTPGDPSSTSTLGLSLGIFVDKYGYLYVSDQRPSSCSSLPARLNKWNQWYHGGWNGQFWIDTLGALWSD